MAKESIRGIFFTIEKFVRDVLSKKTEQELYDLALHYGCQMYTLDEISQMSNDEELPIDNHWIYFIDLNNVKQSYKETTLVIGGKTMHLLLDVNPDEIPKNVNLWDFSLEDFITGAVEVNEKIWYAFHNGRCYETEREV